MWQYDHSFNFMHSTSEFFLLNEKKFKPPILKMIPTYIHFQPIVKIEMYGVDHDFVPTSSSRWISCIETISTTCKVRDDLCPLAGEGSWWSHARLELRKTSLKFTNSFCSSPLCASRYWTARWSIPDPTMNEWIP